MVRLGFEVDVLEESHSIMSLEQLITEKVSALPVEQRQEVLDFVEFLAFRGKCSVASAVPPLASLAGRSPASFKTADEVDAALRSERDSWDR